MLITMKALRGKWKADKLTHISSNCHKRNYILLIPRMYKHISPFSKSSFPLLCHFCTLMVSGSIWQQDLLLALPPFLWLLLPCIRVDLVPHPAQDIGGGFSGHNEWLNHCWWQLTENSTHRPRHPTLFMLPGGCVIDGQCCVCDPLCMETPKNPIKRQFFNVNVVWVNNIYFLYLFYHCVGFGYTFPQINGLMSKSVMSVPFYPLCVSFVRHWRHHVISRLSCCLRWHKQWNEIVTKALEVNADFFYLQWKDEFTWMVRTILLVSSRAAIAVDVPKEAVPRWNPRTIRPSFLYCSIGSQTRSLNPWTEQTKTFILKIHLNQ